MNIKHVHFNYSVRLEFVPFKLSTIKSNSTNKIKGEEFFSELDRILHDIVDSYNIDNWNDKQNDDDEF